MIQVDGLAIEQGDFSLTDVSFKIQSGTYAILMGKTGSGKTTILEAILGLRPIQSGRIHLLNQDVTQLKTAERGVGYVPQDLALFPTMSVHEHLAFALGVRHWGKNDIEERVNELAKLLGIRYLLHRKPQGLSGGESQRVALGRALSFRPKVLLLDEPLSALDESTREEMYELLQLVQRHTGVTALHITHSQTEAKRLGDLVLRIEHGKVQPMPSGENNGNADSHSLHGSIKTGSRDRV